MLLLHLAQLVMVIFPLLVCILRQSLFLLYLLVLVVSVSCLVVFYLLLMKKMNNFAFNLKKTVVNFTAVFSFLSFYSFLTVTKNTPIKINILPNQKFQVICSSKINQPKNVPTIG